MQPKKGAKIVWINGIICYIMSKEKNKIRKYDATEYMKKYI